MEICPVCVLPVDVSTEAHVIGANGETFHAECYNKELEVSQE
jgi:hypothetical protein